MAILNYTTKIDVHKTIGELSAILVKNGASKISVDYGAGGTPEAVTFVINGPRPAALSNIPVLFYQLPARYEGVLKAMKSQNVPRTLQNKDQALRVAWRNVKDWVAAQMAMIEAEQCEIQEVFLPYLVLGSGNTVYDEIKNDNVKLLQK